MTTTVHDEVEAPRYRQIAAQLEDLIVSGRLEPGNRLPSFVQMRKRYGATPATVERVYLVLEKRGLIRREPNRGVYVAEPKPKAKPVLGILAFSVTMDHPYYVPLLKGIQETVRSLGADLALYHEESIIEPDRVNGLLVFGNALEFQQSLPPGIPRVIVMETESGDAPFVSIDNRAGIVASIEHLVALGHRRIGFLTFGDPDGAGTVSGARVTAYLDALRSAVIEPDPRWVRPLIEWNERHNVYTGFVELGRRKMELWLRDNWFDLNCTALLAQNDETAIGAIQALNDAGIKVPEQVSVVGFDGTEIGASIRPRLTTVKLPLEKVGATATGLLMKLVGGHADGFDGVSGAKPTDVTLPIEFLARESTAVVWSD